jgi:hypothetical protein
MSEIKHAADQIKDAANQIVASQLAAALIAKDGNFTGATTESIQAAIELHGQVLQEIKEAAMRARKPVNVGPEALDQARHRS